MMSKADVRIVGISGLTRDYAELISGPLQEQGFGCETVSMPWVGVRNFTPSVLARLKAELRNNNGARLTVYCSGSAEFYVPGPHLSVHFSAYRSWFRPNQMRIVAHPWTDAEPAIGDKLKWSDKPPLIVGFMGTAYSNSRLAHMLSVSPLKQWVLGGHHLRTPTIRAALNAAKLPMTHAVTFPRPETLTALKNYAASTGMDVRIVDTGGYTGSAEQIEKYQRNMQELTYVLCPRGIENYSYRLYESLKFGRVPVLVDTQTVLPEEVDWDDIILRVPYGQLADIGNFIVGDYERHSGASFRRRQEKALEVMARLCAGGWAEGLVKDVRSRLGSARSANSAPFAEALPA